MYVEIVVLQRLRESDRGKRKRNVRREEKVAKEREGFLRNEVSKAVLALLDVLRS